MNAYQAYYEFMPLRRSAFPQGPHMKLYRKCQYGRLANFYVLDTRQYRTDQPNGDGQKPKTGKVAGPKRHDSWNQTGTLVDVWPDAIPSEMERTRPTSDDGGSKSWR